MGASATMVEADVKVEWTNPWGTSSVAGYRVLRGNTYVLLSSVATVGSWATTYTDQAPVAEGEFLWYQVQAIDASGQVVAESAVVPVQPA